MRCTDINPSDSSVMVRGLRKVYKNVGEKAVVAVRDISFGLEYGECFALLGVNGAGKTTTFKALTKEIYPSAGDVYINGNDIDTLTGFNEARKMIGYCPQFDAIFEGLTVKEHIEFYAKMKGVIKEKRDVLIEE